jgi:flagellar M-ring protein FliF
MNDFFKKLFSRISSLWGGWSMVQRVILIGIVVGVIVGIAALLRVSAAPTLVPVIDAPIRDEAALDRIVLRLNQENVKVSVSANGLVQVPDETTAKRMRAILISENLIPTGIDPWQIFDRDRWTITDFERNINWQRSITQVITNTIKALDDVDDANVNITFPEKELFRSDQKPVSASVIIFPKPGSDITQNRKKVEGIQRILKSAISGLQDENITITDNNSLVLNDFEGMAAFDRLTMIERQHKFIQTLETQYRAKIISSLQSTFSKDRVRDLNVKIDMDMSDKIIDEIEYKPFVLNPRTPGLPYDDSVKKDSVLLSETISETKWEGTGYNPEGPAGVEGQTPPAFKDMSNLYGKMIQTTRTHNEELNKITTHEEKSPSIFDRVSVSVNIDGKWKIKYDEKGNPVILPDNSIDREYTPMPVEQLRDATAIIQDAIGFSASRSDSVTVRNIPFDRETQFKDEDAAYFRKKQIQLTIIIFLSGLTILLVGFIIFRMIQREIERRRRLAEEERARREQMLRESAMAEAEQEGVPVSISVEERTRMELMESVINMAKEHPEDCAQLIRTWILED